MENYERSSEKEDIIKDAIEMAIFYCEEKIPIADSWSSFGLRNHLKNLKEIQDEIKYGKYAVCQNLNYEP